jgi:hypothetical protein
MIAMPQIAINQFMAMALIIDKGFHLFRQAMSMPNPKGEQSLLLEVFRQYFTGFRIKPNKRKSQLMAVLCYASIDHHTRTDADTILFFAT